jgi:hypothetical protein
MFEKVYISEDNYKAGGGVIAELYIEDNKKLMDFLTKKAEERNTTLEDVVAYYVRKYKCRYQLH